MNLPELFRNYLKSQKVLPVTRKNYVTDVNNFLSWLAQKTGIKYQIAGKAILGLFTQETLKEYCSDLLARKTPLSTINRRLSALRKFGQFAQIQGWIGENPAEKVANVHHPQERYSPTLEVLEDFQKHLEKEKVSQLTIKNYLSDLRHFLEFLEAV